MTKVRLMASSLKKTKENLKLWDNLRALKLTIKWMISQTTTRKMRAINTPHLLRTTFCANPATKRSNIPKKTLWRPSST
jgi:hypothetical protein